MNEAKEKEPLLSTHSTNQKFHCSKRYVLLEVIGCLHFVAFVALTPIQQFYVIDETAKKYGQQAETNKNICTTSNFTNSTYDKVQEESANILTFLTFFSTALAVIPILVLGSLTDRYGRKVPLLISLFGLLAKEIVMLVTVYRGLSLWYLVIGEICIGLTGHFGLPLAAIMGMIADTTKAGQERATRITIIEAVVASAVALSNLGVGFWIKDGNYKDSIIMCVSLSTFAILLTFGCLPETLTKEKRTSSTFCSREMLGTCIKLYRKDKRRSMLIIGQIIFCINVGAVLGKVNVLTLYLLHHPLCWSEIHVQVFSCISTLINWVAIIFGVRLLHKYLKDCTIVIIGSVSAVASLVVLAFATKDWIVYARKYHISGLP